MFDPKDLNRVYEQQELERQIQEYGYDNKELILNSSLCLCVACGTICTPVEINQWYDGKDAVCTNEDCRLTGVIIGDASGLDFSMFSN